MLLDNNLLLSKGQALRKLPLPFITFCWEAQNRGVMDSRVIFLVVCPSACLHVPARLLPSLSSVFWSRDLKHILHSPRAPYEESLTWPLFLCPGILYCHCHFCHRLELCNWPWISITTCHLPWFSLLPRLSDHSCSVPDLLFTSAPHVSSWRVKLLAALCLAVWKVREGGLSVMWASECQVLVVLFFILLLP